MNLKLIRILTAILWFLPALAGMVQNHPNVLFIAVDDLRPELGCYGSEVAVTPNLDALAADGLLFSNAFCQQAICAPSRASIMTGTRPDTNGVTHNYVMVRDKIPDILTLPQHFRNNGYETVYIGKIFHAKDTDEELSWSRAPARISLKRTALFGGYALPENQELARQNSAEMIAKYGEAARQGLGSGPAYECADVPDTTYADGYNTEVAIATLKDLVNSSDKPFFLALGFMKPHLHWISPKKYWDLYDRDKIPLAESGSAPVDGAAMGLHASFELRTRADIPKYGPIDEDMSRVLKHAYLACTSYIDAQIGRMVAALEEAGVRDNTIVVVWSDHGWHLGDMGVWGKATNYEIATRVPLIIRTPGMPDTSRGTSSGALVELVDLYPTLCDLAGLELPAHLEGHSFKPLISNPDLPWKKAVFSQYSNPALREWAANPLSEGMRETFFGPLIEDVEERIRTQFGDKWDRDLFENRLAGYAMRTDRYRLVVWKDTGNPDSQPLFVELYDHAGDPNESKNIARENPEVVDALLRQFESGWQGNLPR